MEYCKIVPKIFVKNGELVASNETCEKIDKNVIELCEEYENNGADEIIIFEISNNDEEHDKNIGLIKDIVAAVDLPILLGGNVKRFEDIKKYLYAGAKMAVLDGNKESNVLLIKEACDRFGNEKIAVEFEAAGDTFTTLDDEIDVLHEVLDAAVNFQNLGAALFVTGNKISKNLMNFISESNMNILSIDNNLEIDEVKALGVNQKFYGFSSDKLINQPAKIMLLKNNLKESKINVNAFESTMNFSEFKLNSEGHIPVVVQDYKTKEVLMVAYMNQEAFNETIKTGVMTYFSRSRNELWIKGETSGHYQYVKSLTIDCDNDTLLAKVKQVGAACHTGNKTCFFNNIMEKEFDQANPLKVFENVFNVIKDRKVNPKEGSYTNYLFDKGIDKILKKVGEEATEIVIAAKNPDKEEIKYEISDFLYHVMVLMAECNVTWEDITKELSRR